MALPPLPFYHSRPFDQIHDVCMHNPYEDIRLPSVSLPRDCDYKERTLLGGYETSNDIYDQLNLILNNCGIAVRDVYSIIHQYLIPRPGLFIITMSGTFIHVTANGVLPTIVTGIPIPQAWNSKSIARFGNWIISIGEEPWRYNLFSGELITIDSEDILPEQYKIQVIQSDVKTHHKKLCVIGNTSITVNNSIMVFDHALTPVHRIIDFKEDVGDLYCRPFVTVVFQNRLYVLGLIWGPDAALKRNSYILNEECTKFVALNNPIPLRADAVVYNSLVVNDKILLFTNKEAHLYEPATDNWSTITNWTIPPRDVIYDLYFPAFYDNNQLFLLYHSDYHRPSDPGYIPFLVCNFNPNAPSSPEWKHVDFPVSVPKNNPDMDFLPTSKNLDAACCLL